MAVLPTVPAFVAADTSLVKLQQLSYATQFLCDLDTRPLWHYYMTAPTFNFSATTWSTVAFDHSAYDSDGVSGATPPGYEAAGGGLPVATIQTQGIYTVEGCAECTAQVTEFKYKVSFLATAGANNPHHTNGTTLRFGQRGTATSTTANTETALCSSMTCPWVLYPGDTVAFQVFAGISSTISSNLSTNNPWTNRFGPYFSGYFAQNGT